VEQGGGRDRRHGYTDRPAAKAASQKKEIALSSQSGLAGETRGPPAEAIWCGWSDLVTCVARPRTKSAALQVDMLTRDAN
jgi:hypothetical protein